MLKVTHRRQHGAKSDILDICFACNNGIGRPAYLIQTRSPAVAEGPREAGVPVEILSAVERLGYTPN